MIAETVRVRFAPSPTGILHLGNIRGALVNYLFAHQKNGVFVLRIEDTDQQRDFDHEGKLIIADLAWLGLTYDEGPMVGGPYEPYLQSARSSIYQKYLQELLSKRMVYRCFCTSEELELKRQRQIALKKPPRYDRACAQLSEETVEQHLASKKPFIWRFALSEETITATDLARGSIHFDLKNFSDFPLTRQNGSFTFIFANLVDDIEMRITHIMRGEEHISTTALQIAMYRAFQKEIPIFWHWPIICTLDGKKLSKRDFGFSLNDLRSAGFVPQAIINYLGIIGGSFEQEIMTLDELAQATDFEQHASAGFIRYDAEKLRWINHKWLSRFSLEELTAHCRPYIETAYPSAASINDEKLSQILQPLRNEFVTLADAASLTAFYFTKPVIDKTMLADHKVSNYKGMLAKIVELYKPTQSPQEFFDTIRTVCKQENGNLKELCHLIRISLTGQPQGAGIRELVTILPYDEVIERLSRVIQTTQE